MKCFRVDRVKSKKVSGGCFKPSVCLSLYAPKMRWLNSLSVSLELCSSTPTRRCANHLSAIVPRPQCFKIRRLFRLPCPLLLEVGGVNPTGKRKVPDQDFVDPTTSSALSDGMGATPIAGGNRAGCKNAPREVESSSLVLLLLKH